ncbi:hypothetical protein FA95DRAFT_979046 [Auriscalpium vulgare]|uniref:Uncharacterized protein n=1 Tax=Auriscalpium vulgare TaxID=40419 RepID=A0ACB8RZE0_9AGAM|nr:hypothetical protein FA95DRAFT_979046 [Auriscalpium vulgare]
MLILLPLAYSFLTMSVSGSPVANLTASMSDSSSTGTSKGSSLACSSTDPCRTLSNIIWSCLATIFACIWKAVHRNVPKFQDPKQSWFRRKLERAVGAVKIIAVTLLVPEWVLSCAVRQRLHASRLGEELENARGAAKKAWKKKKRMRLVSEDDGGKRSAGAGFGDGEKSRISELTDPGEGFEVEIPASAFGGDGGELERAGHTDILLIPTGASEQTPVNASENVPQVLIEERLGRLDGKWTSRHGYFIIMGGFHFYDAGKPVHPLSSEDVIRLVAAGELIPPTDAEIEALGQGDALSKGLAVVQTLWFIIQFVARRASGLLVTELEVVTLAYTMITIAMYVVWWDKPQNVSAALRVAKSPSTGPLPTSYYGPKKPAQGGSWMFHYANGIEDKLVNLATRNSVPTFYSGPSGTGGPSGACKGLRKRKLPAAVVAFGILCYATVGFGSLHFLSWSSPTFPSSTERFIWRVCSAIIVILPIMGSSCFQCLAIVRYRKSPMRRRRTNVWDVNVDGLASSLFLASGVDDSIASAQTAGFAICFFLYIVTRLILLVLSFITLRSLPALAFETVSWTDSIIHWH